MMTEEDLDREHAPLIVEHSELERSITGWRLTERMSSRIVRIPNDSVRILAAARLPERTRFQIDAALSVLRSNDVAVSQLNESGWRESIQLLGFANRSK